MAKWYGKIGFIVSKETTQPGSRLGTGVWVDKPVERSYYGDITRNIRRLTGAERVNENLAFNNELSIVADPFAYENFHAIRYVEYMGTKWRVSSVEAQYPRLVLYFGEVYNG